MKRSPIILVLVFAGLILALSADAQQGNLENGAALYAEHCAVCHGAAGEGLIGPSLIDCSICDSYESLVDRIESPTHRANAPGCVETCPQDVAAHIFVTLNGNTLSDECTVYVTGLETDIAGALQTQDSVTFTLSAISTCFGDIYYRFDLIPNYGTADYDPFNDFQIIQDFSTDNTAAYTFEQSGSYILVGWASATPSIPLGAAPIMGGSITVE